MRDRVYPRKAHWIICWSLQSFLLERCYAGRKLLLEFLGLWINCVDFGFQLIVDFMWKLMANWVILILGNGRIGVCFGLEFMLILVVPLCLSNYSDYWSWLFLCVYLVLDLCWSFANLDFLALSLCFFFKKKVKGKKYYFNIQEKMKKNCCGVYLYKESKSGLIP